MLRSYAILMDGAFVLKRLKARLKRHPTATDVVTESDRIRSLPVLGRLSLLRIDFYDAPPATRLIRNPIDGQEINLGRTDVHRRCQALQDALALTPDHALRLGETDVRGWWMNGRRIRSLVGLPHPRSLQPTDIEPDIQQKGVDLRIGLDIARL